MPTLLQQPLRLLIDGQWVGCASGASMDVINPSTGEVLAQEALGGAAEIDQAVQAARRALEAGPWARMRPAERTRLLLKLADALESTATSSPCWKP
ncbi:MAG: aldehyde dehydrogenase family protein [Hydrogenophaga sp.]|nr:aldehyde dehydrogenase family protein [Hydrogenophaga sp.]